MSLTVVCATPAGLVRARFLQSGLVPAVAACERRVLDLLMAQDGSTTRLCETVAGGPVDLYLPHQALTEDVPDIVRASLPGRLFIERQVCLAAHGEAMMDNLSYIALEGLPDDLRADLEAGRAPIGHLLDRLWVRRQFDETGAAPLRQRLWARCGLPDAEATRTHRVLAPQGPLMLITETWRRGMLMRRSVD